MTDAKKYSAHPFDDASSGLLVVADELATAIAALRTRLARYHGRRPWGGADPGAQFGEEYTRIEPVGLDALQFTERQVYYMGVALTAAAEIVRAGQAGDEEILARLTDYLPTIPPVDGPACDPGGAA